MDGAPDGAQQGEGREGQRGEGGLTQQRGQMEAHQQEGEHSHQHRRWDTCAQLIIWGWTSQVYKELQLLIGNIGRKMPLMDGVH